MRDKKRERNGFEACLRPRLRANPSVRCDFSPDFSLVSRLPSRSSVQIRGERGPSAARRRQDSSTDRAFELHDDRRTPRLLPHSASSRSSEMRPSRIHFTAILPGDYSSCPFAPERLTLRGPDAMFSRARIVANSSGRLLSPSFLAHVTGGYRSRIHRRILLHVRMCMCVCV